MGLVRFVIIAATIWLAIIVVRGLINRKPKIKKEAKESVDKIIPCAHCGLHIPHSEAIQRGKMNFCCQEHADKTP